MYEILASPPNYGGACARSAPQSRIGR